LYASSSISVSTPHAPRSTKSPAARHLTFQQLRFCQHHVQVACFGMPCEVYCDMTTHRHTLGCSPPRVSDAPRVCHAVADSSTDILPCPACLCTAVQWTAAADRGTNCGFGRFMLRPLGRSSQHTCHPPLKMKMRSVLGPPKVWSLLSAYSKHCQRLVKLDSQLMNKAEP
jgi:hypothetical protein